jgi:predicted MFS family arabinose efflux permease
VLAGLGRLLPTTAILIAVGFVDELASGVATSGAPELQQTFATSYAELATVIMLVPGIVGLCLEPPLFLLADRWPRRWFITGGFAGMVASMIVAALAPGPITFAIAISLYGIASGAAVGLAQATLVDANPTRRAAIITRWTLLAALGDGAAPALLTLVAALGLTWRAGYLVLAGVIAAWAIVVALRPLPVGFAPPAPDGEGAPAPAPTLWPALVAAIRNRRLVGWLFALVLCDLLDEILVVLASLHLRDTLGAGPEWRTIVLVALVAGSVIGLVAVERLLVQVAATRLLVWTAIACAVTYAVWLCAPTPLASAILMVPVGITSAPLYPLTAAQAYAANPGKSGAVLAIGHLFTPLALALPWLLGAVADAWGLPIALGLLAIQPVGLAIMAIAVPVEESPPRA